MKKFQIILLSFLAFTTISAQNASSDIRNLTALEVAEEMAPGLNLFNTLDAACGGGLASEICWGNPYTTFEMVEVMAERGFKTLRIPVTWHNHMGSDTDYEIDEEWMDRVEEVVNYALDNGMYAIVNIHHDDEQFTPIYEQQDESTAWVEGVWTQIAERFKDYNDYLLFETLNEPREVGSSQEWTGGSAEHREVVNALNLAAVNIIRNSGGNNAERFIMVPQVGANSDAAIADMIIPNNDTNIIVSVHNYYPFSFCLDGNGSSTWGTDQEVKDLENAIKSVGDHFVANGQAVIMGEWGAGDKDNYDQRINYYNTFTEICKENKITPIVWIFGFNRNTLTWEAPLIEEGILRHYRDTIIDLDSLKMNIHNDTLYVGDSLQLSFNMYPEGTVPASDIIWTSTKSKVAAVNDSGLVMAKAGGKTEIKVTYFGVSDACEVVVIDTVTHTTFLIQSEDFDQQSGVQVEACGDEDGGQNIGYIENGDWCKYSITVDSAGIYRTIARVATDANGGTIEFSINNKVLGEIAVDPSQSNGWQDYYTTEPIEITLDKGSYTLKQTFKGSGSLFNVNWFELSFDRIVGIQSVNKSQDLKVYPNPVNDQLNIVSEFEIQHVNIFNIQGQSVYAKPINNKSTTLHLDLIEGVYMVHVSTNNESIIKKIIVQ